MHSLRQNSDNVKPFPAMSWLVWHCDQSDRIRALSPYRRKTASAELGGLACKLAFSPGWGGWRGGLSRPSRSRWRLLGPRDTESMQNQAVLKCQEVGIDGHRECIANARVLCDAPRLVIRQTFAVETSFAGDEFLLVARDDLLMDGHKHSPRSRPSTTRARIGRQCER